jgi:hypothetical protein
LLYTTYTMERSAYVMLAFVTFACYALAVSATTEEAWKLTHNFLAFQFIFLVSLASFSSVSVPWITFSCLLPLVSHFALHGFTYSCRRPSRMLKKRPMGHRHQLTPSLLLPPPHPPAHHLLLHLPDHARKFSSSSRQVIHAVNHFFYYQLTALSLYHVLLF